MYHLELDSNVLYLIWQGGLGMLGCKSGWGHIFQSAVGAIVVVLFSPIFDDASSFLQSVEQITIQALLPKLAIKAFNIGILPRTARRDVDRLATLLCQPFLHPVGDQFWSIVAAQVLRFPINQKQPI